MNPLRCVPPLALCMVLAACGATTSTGGLPPPGTGSPAAPPPPVEPLPSAIVLREAPADLGCDSIGWQGDPYRTLTFHVDPEAVEPVWAESDTGAMLTTYWSSGFRAGTPGERVVRSPSGHVFISDGEVVEVPQGANLYINDYFVCLEPDKLYVLTTERG